MSNKILLIDDDPLTRKSLTDALQVEHYEVFPAATRQQAIDAHGEQRVNLLVLSLDCGAETFNPGDLRWLGDIDKRLPIILLTKGCTLGRKPQSAMADELMERPVDFGFLLGTIGGLMSETVEARDTRIGARHALVLPFAGMRDGQFRELLRARGTTEYFCDASNIELPVEAAIKAHD